MTILIRADKESNIKKKILILFSSSSGEIDWLLPICRYLKKNYQGIKLSVLFDAIDSNEIMKDDKLLYCLLSKNVDNCYDFGDFLPSYIKPILNPLIRPKNKGENIDKKEQCLQRVKTYLFTFIKIIAYKKIMKAIRPDILLKDISPDIFGVRRHIVLYAKKNKCTQIMFPHATEPHKYTNPKPRYDCYADHVLCASKWMTKLFSEFGEYKNFTHVVGNPRYDEWWINYITKFYKKHSTLKDFNFNNKTVFLFFTQYAHSQLTFSEKVSKEIIEEVMSTLMNYKNSFVIVKPHPRENLNILKRKLEKYNNKRWIISQGHPIYLSSMSDIIVCMGASSVVLDSLALDKMVIEYYKYSDIEYENIYGKHGVVAIANNKNQLKDIIDNLKKKPELIKKPFLKNFREVVPESYDESTKKAAKVIINLLKNS